MGSAPFLGGGFGHFYAYAPSKIEYAIDRYAMEVKRQLDVLDRRLAESPYLAGDDYTIADIAVWPWYGTLVKGQLYGAGEFLQVHEYANVLRWTDEIAQRPAVQRGRMVNRTWGQPSSQLHERHDASDFETRTADKLALGRLTARGNGSRTMITLYDCATAPSPRRARILLAEKGIAHETVEVDLRGGEQLGDAYRAVNPQCTVPALRTDDGLLLTDNAAIAACSRRASPSLALLGVTPAEKAEIASWNWRVEFEGLLAIAEAMRNSAPAMADRALPGPVNYAQIPELAQRGLARVQQFFVALDERLAGRGLRRRRPLQHRRHHRRGRGRLRAGHQGRVDEQHPQLQRWRAAMARGRRCRSSSTDRAFVRPGRGSLSDLRSVAAGEESEPVHSRASDDRSPQHRPRQEGPAGKEAPSRGDRSGCRRKPQPGKKTHMEHHASDTPKVPDEAAAEDTAKPRRRHALPRTGLLPLAAVRRRRWRVGAF